MRGDKRSESRGAFGQRSNQMLGIETLPAVDGARGAAICERTEKIERVGVAHRHDQQRTVALAEPKFRLCHKGKHGAPGMRADSSFWLPGRARRVHQAPGIASCPAVIRSLIPCGRALLL